MVEDVINEKTTCESYYIAHCNAIEDSQNRIKAIEETIRSLPHEVKVIQEALDKMSTSMDKLLERLEEKYVSKELYETSMKALDKSFREYRDVRDKETQKLADKQDWIIRGAFVIGLYILRDVIAFIASK